MRSSKRSEQRPRRRYSFNYVLRREDDGGQARRGRLPIKMTTQAVTTTVPE